MKSIRILATALLGFTLASLLGMAQNLPPRQVWAEEYAQWSFTSQSANSYVFAGTNCQVYPVTSGTVPSFFAFGNPTLSYYYPVLIQDQSGSNTTSEVVTPTTLSITTGACGFSATTVNAHASFYVKSGTGGLAEAVGSLSPSSSNTASILSPANVLLDKTWYNYIAALPQTAAKPQTPALVIASVTGSVAVNIVDTTTEPWTTYSWNGSIYTAASGPGNFFNLRTSSYTNIAAPTALTTVAATCLSNGGGCITTTTTGGSIPTGAAYRLGATCVDPSGGETTLSIDTAAGAVVTTGAGSTNAIQVTSPAGCTTANGAVGWRLYMSAASGASLSEILYTPTSSATPGYLLQNVLNPTTVLPIGATASITAIITGTATIPLLNTAYPRVGSTSGSFPPFTAAGTVAAASASTLGVINFPAGYLNSLGRQLKVCGNGYATTNGTGGTVTLKATLYSVPGVTSINPFSVVSPAIAASVIQVPIDFCMIATTAATGATGTLEVHGWVDYGVAGTAVGSLAQDIIFAVSSTVDLTKQDQLVFTLANTTLGTTAAQLRQTEVFVSN